MKDKTFDQLYKKVPREQKGRLLRFRATHPGRQLTAGNATWEYLVGGQGEETLLILHGSTGNAESFFQQIMRFEERYRVIAPTYPPATTKTMAEVVAGLLGLLEAEGVQAAHVLGISLGGLVAQAFVRKHPDRVKSLILSHTGLPTREAARPLEQRLKTVSLLPSWLVFAVARRRFLKRLEATAEEMPAAERAFWLAFRSEAHTFTVTREVLMARLKVHIDFHRNHSFTPGDLADWPGRILIIESDGDRVIKPPYREALKAFYPQARAHTFHGSGHASALVKTEENVAIIGSFLAGA